MCSVIVFDMRTTIWLGVHPASSEWVSQVPSHTIYGHFEFLNIKPIKVNIYCYLYARHSFGTFHILPHLILTRVLCGKYYYYHHFTDGETDQSKSRVTGVGEEQTKITPQAWSLFEKLIWRRPVSLRRKAQFQTSLGSNERGSTNEGIFWYLEIRNLFNKSILSTISVPNSM